MDQIEELINKEGGSIVFNAGHGAKQSYTRAELANRWDLSSLARQFMTLFMGSGEHVNADQIYQISNQLEIKHEEVTIREELTRKAKALAKLANKK
jgi:hypothetical protein